MIHGTLLLGCILVTVLSASVSAPATESKRFIVHHENVLGTSFELRVRAADAATAAKAEAAALAEIDRLSAIFSGYSPDSEFSRWQKTHGKPTPVSPELFDVLSASESWREQSHGAFNPGAEAFSQLWKASAKSDSVPTAAQLKATALQVAQPAWKLNSKDRTAAHLSDTPLTLNAIAKGYIIEQASAAAWKVGGIEGLMLEVGGDLRVRGQFNETVAIADPKNDAENARPLTTVRLHDVAMATSGSYRRGVDVQGRHFSHIIDPRTGEAANQIAGVSVIAPDTAMADALSTTFSVLSPEESLRLAEATKGVACLLVLADGRMVRSSRWPADDASSSSTMADGAATGADALELAVAFEINRVEGGRYLRPYVAAWIEDKDGFPVRTILLWHLQAQKGQRWMPELRRWYRADEMRHLAEGKELPATVSSATRNPGKYSVVWDGKDDHGKPVAAGQYTFYLESAREHGTYQLMKHEFGVGGKTFTTTLKDNEEIKGVSLEYRSKTGRK